MEFVDFALYLSYTLAIVAAIIAPLLAFLTSLNNMQALVKTGLSLVGIGVLFLVAYSLSGNEVTAEYTKFNIGPDMSKLIGGSLILAYLLAGVTAIALIYTETAKIFK